ELPCVVWMGVYGTCRDSDAMAPSMRRSVRKALLRMTDALGATGLAQGDACVRTGRKALRQERQAARAGDLRMTYAVPDSEVGSLLPASMSRYRRSVSAPGRRPSTIESRSRQRRKVVRAPA